MHFDEQIDRRGSNCDKWDNMEAKYGVSPADGLAMWVADGDFRPPACVQQAVQDMAAHGIYGYYGALDHYHKAICWWMETRHNWRGVWPKISPNCKNPKMLGAYRLFNACPSLM